MITIEENVSLRTANTFGIDVMASWFCRISSVSELQELIRTSVYQNHRRFVLGEGSNVLFTHDFEGLIIKIEIKGIEIVHETDDRVIISAGAGESWHELVMYCVNHGWGGVENLSFIPGTAGAAPIQNIGAYGVEIKNQIENVAGVDAVTGTLRIFGNEECQFGYRESVFKRTLREKYFISSITLSLTKRNHFFNVGYGALINTLKQHGVEHEKDFTVKSISDAVIEIRKQKLPDVHVLGSAGSFFKNPSVPDEKYVSLKNKWPEIPSYPSVNQSVKLAAGWLIEQCGWKGKRYGNVGVHQHQALVIVNYGNGSGAEIFQLAMNIRASVLEKFDVLLEAEVNII